MFKANELKGFDTTKIRVNESLDNHFADFPDDQRYYKGTKVRIINKEPSDKEKKEKGTTLIISCPKCNHIDAINFVGKLDVKSDS